MIYVILICWIVYLYFKLEDIIRRNFIEWSNSTLLILKKDKEIRKLEKEVSYWKNKKSYEDYLND